MTNHATLNVEGIAASLSKPQREWLAKQQPTLEPVAAVPCAEWWDCPPLYVTVDGEDHWLAHQSMRSPEGSPTFTSGETQPTDLGLAVRAALLKEKDQ